MGSRPRVPPGGVGSFGEAAKVSGGVGYSGVHMLVRWLLAFFLVLTVLLTILGVLLFLPAS